MATTLYYARHGRAYCNDAKRFHDDSKVPLNATGRKQAKELGRNLKKLGVKFDAIYCSPYRRAKETCAIALATMGMTDHGVQFSQRLKERGFKGLYDVDISRSEYHELFKYDSDFSKECGIETLEAMEARAKEFIDEKKALWPDGNLLVFSHGALGLIFRVMVEGRPESGDLFDFQLLKNGEIMKLVLE